MTNIVKLDSAKYSDIPKLLRNLADNMEQGDYGSIPAGVVILEKLNHEILVFGLGAGEAHRAIALMAGGQQILIQKQFGVSKETD